MASFFLYRCDAAVDSTAVVSVFAAKGFREPQCFELGQWRLWLYRKQCVCEENFVQRADGSAVFAVGTPIYRANPYRVGLAAALEDFANGGIAFQDLRGNYCLLFWVKGRLTLLTDALDVCHVFVDRERTRFSTSLLGVLASFRKRQRLNRLAVLEKLATGYTVGPETILESVEQLTPELRRGLKADGLKTLAFPKWRLNVSPARQSLEECVTEHLRRLRRYFIKIGPIAREHGVDLGLSSGYDSRLVALLMKPEAKDFSVHTHWVRGVHDSEKKRVEDLARALGLGLRVHAEHPLEALPTEALEDTLLDGLYYYDGRSADNSGAYSPTYTRRYKTLTLGAHRLRLNGEGGEIYRNYYQTARRRVPFVPWMRSRLYYDSTPLALAGTDLEEEMTAHIVRKLTERLEADMSGTVDLAVTRAYYGEVRLPDCEGVLANADMQVAHFLMPFAESELQRAAYGLTPHIGVAGRFQCALIQGLDRVIAALPSHYGFPISGETLRYRAKAAIRGYVPDTMWLRRKARWFADPQFGHASAEGYRKVYERSHVVREAEEALRAYVPGFDPKFAVREPAAKATAVFLGVFLREFSNKLAT